GGTAASWRLNGTAFDGEPTGMIVNVTSSVSASVLETDALKPNVLPCATLGAAVGLSATETAARAIPGAASAASAAAQTSVRAALRLIELGILPLPCLRVLRPRSADRDRRSVTRPPDGSASANAIFTEGASS